MSSQRPAGESQILVSYCVGCDKVTFDANPDTDQCECGRELYPVQRFLKKGKAYAIGDPHRALALGYRAVGCRQTAHRSLNGPA